MNDEAVLRDVTASGKERPWKEKKIANETLAIVYEKIDGRKSARLNECCDYLFFRVYEDGTRKLDKMNCCRVRLCPMCNWRRSLKVYSNMTRIMDGLESDNLAFLYLTLTVKNTDGSELSKTIDGMMYAWKKLTFQKEFKKVTKGYYRAMEVTHNVNPLSTSYDTFHPHYHVVLAVNKSYLKSRDYIKKEKWSAMWKQALGADYDPIIDIRRVKGVCAKAVGEAAGYAVKDEEYIIPEHWELTERTVRTLDSALNKRRFISYGGIMKEMHRKLNLDDEERGDLVNVDDEAVKNDVNYREEVYRWMSGYNQYMIYK